MHELATHADILRIAPTQTVSPYQMNPSYRLETFIQFIFLLKTVMIRIPNTLLRCPVFKW